MKAIYLCSGDLRPGKRADCPNSLHDCPEPAGYVDASEVAARRLYNRWTQRKCPDCALYGWIPGKPLGDKSDQRVPWEGSDDA